ncbi:uncharacterized membrane protein YjjP (DUF1212 family) [Peptoniphilus ivorii]|uniref:threonine/serine ThrE exporter family protein n=1 Tax=Aedoeadaptatus ivorii TaxID=54006 RepID=UPI0027859A3D|nr:threonine/serine exporter family protein [Peptoniphilus ivorii]MDQ0507854.1 uncharacterized membrane protein YjjP (DUF1212 family) [Peptoniphilus ivorii]
MKNNRPSIQSAAEAKELMNLALTTGQMLIGNGAEIYRAEDTIMRMCESRANIRDVDVFALSSAIFLSLDYDNETITIFKDIDSYGTHLGRIQALNAFSREFVESDISLREAREQLLSIWSIPVAPPLTKMFFTGMCSGSFAMLFGGNWADLVYTFFVGAILSFCLYLMSKRNLTFFPEAFFGTLIISLLALVGSFCFAELHMDMIIIGSIMPLVPGMTITNSFRDIISGDYLSGVIGITKGIFVALAIALGVGFVLSFLKVLGG